MYRFHNGGQSIKVLRVAAVFKKQPLPLLCADLGVFHINRHHRRGFATLAILKGDHQRPALDHKGHMERVPVTIVSQEQVFTLLKAQQGLWDESCRFGDP